MLSGGITGGEIISEDVTVPCRNIFNFGVSFWLNRVFFLLQSPKYADEILSIRRSHLIGTFFSEKRSELLHSDVADGHSFLLIFFQWQTSVFKKIHHRLNNWSRAHYEHARAFSSITWIDEIGYNPVLSVLMRANINFRIYHQSACSFCRVPIRVDDYRFSFREL